MNKPQTLQDYHQRLLKVLVTIEKNLDRVLTLDELADVSCFSRFHFQRIFASFMGESVQSHVKRLRLTKAARALVYTDKSITDIALEVAYSTPSSFTKAFKKANGLSPKELRERGAMPGKEDALVHSFIHYEEVDMNYIIKELSEQPLFYYQLTGSYQETPKIAWKKMVDFAAENTISLKEHQLIGYALDDPKFTDEKHLRFTIGITGVECQPQGEFGKQVLAGGRYAVFKHHGHYKTLHQTFDQIYGAWVPNSGYELRDAPAFVHYVEGDVTLSSSMSDTDKAHQVSHIYIPIN